MIASTKNFRVYHGKCLCDPCWCARCECGEKLTAHAFTAEEAAREAEACLASADPRPGFGHPHCKAAA